MTETSTADTAANREIIRQAFDAWRQGTGAVTAVFAPGMIWRIEGHSAASKEYGSKQQFIDEVLTPFGPGSPPQNRSAPWRSGRSTQTATR